MARTALLIVGLVVALMGVLWAMQGAYLVPATFMRGPEWIAIGLSVAAAGAVLVFVSLRKRPPPDPTMSAASVEQIRRVRADEVGADVRPAKPE